MTALSGQVSPFRLEQAVLRVASQLPSRGYFLPQRAPTEVLLWRELAACIIGSRVRFETARSCESILIKSGLLNVPSPHCNYDQLEVRLRSGLQGQLELAGCGEWKPVRHRHPNQTARRLRLTAEHLYGRSPKPLSTLLGLGHPSRSLRKALMEVACGVGPKQASLFLANVGRGNDLAVLDTHVLDYLGLVGILQGPERRWPKTMRQYEAVEARFLSYSDLVRVPVPDLDTAVWVVMRVYKQQRSAR